MDKEIVNKVLNGDTQQFETIVLKYTKMVYNLAYRMLKDFQEAEDISQEVFLKVFKQLKKCKDKETIKTWIYTITYNTCIDLIRKNKNQQNISIFKNQNENDNNDAYIKIESNEYTPEKQVIIKEEVKNLENALNKLDDVSRTIVFLRDVKELSYNEISQITGINIGTIKSRLSRSRNQLKNFLEV